MYVLRFHIICKCVVFSLETLDREHEEIRFFKIGIFMAEQVSFHNGGLDSSS